jgi:DNA primase
MGLCPFHGEKTPSFTVSEEKGIYHCFGCQAGGSVFNFSDAVRSSGFPDAVERVAKRYGIVIERSEQSAAARTREIASISIASTNTPRRTIKKFYFAIRKAGRRWSISLAGESTKPLRANLCSGYAPQGGSGLLQLLRQENIAIQDALRLGLVGERAPRPVP